VNGEQPRPWNARQGLCNLASLEGHVTNSVSFRMKTVFLCVLQLRNDSRKFLSHSFGVMAPLCLGCLWRLVQWNCATDYPVQWCAQVPPWIWVWSVRLWRTKRNWRFKGSVKCGQVVRKQIKGDSHCQKCCQNLTGTVQGSCVTLTSNYCVLLSFKDTWCILKLQQIPFDSMMIYSRVLRRGI